MPQRYLERKFTERTAALLPLLRAGARVLEVGCAEGDLARYLKAVVSITYWGVEPSRDAETARPLLDALVPDTRVIPADTPSFDGIFSFHVLEHIFDLAGELARWRAMTHTQSWVMIEVPCRSGHPDLDTDQNPEHLHHFSPSSLACLLERSAFDLVSLTRGHFESPVYSDSLRAFAIPRPTPKEQREHLLQRFSHLPTPFAVFGIGGDFRSYVLPLLNQLPVVALIDTHPRPFTGLPDGFSIEHYNRERHGFLPVLICSLRYETSIFRDLRNVGHPVELIYLLADIYQEAPNT